MCGFLLYTFADIELKKEKFGSCSSMVATENSSLDMLRHSIF